MQWTAAERPTLQDGLHAFGKEESFGPLLLGLRACPEMAWGLRTQCRQADTVRVERGCSPASGIAWPRGSWVAD